MYIIYIIKTYTGGISALLFSLVFWVDGVCHKSRGKFLLQKAYRIWDFLCYKFFWEIFKGLIDLPLFS